MKELLFQNSYYTDNIMMWLSVDPMSDKYPSMSPYMYCAGNPIMVNDPNGDTLAINYRGTNILYNNGSLYNSDGSLYTGKVGGYLKAAVGAIERLNGTAEGASIVSELQNSDNMFVIMRHSENDFKANNANMAMANLEEYKSVTGDTRGSNGSGGIIYWNPYITTGGMDEKGSTYRPPYIGLAHEMCHASDANRGVLYMKLKGPYTSPLTGKTYDPMYGGIPKAEWSATGRENIIRQEAGLQRRKYYGTDSSSTNLLAPRNMYCY